MEGREFGSIVPMFLAWGFPILALTVRGVSICWRKCRSVRDPALLNSFRLRCGTYVALLALVVLTPLAAVSTLGTDSFRVFVSLTSAGLMAIIGLTNYHRAVSPMLLQLNPGKVLSYTFLTLNVALFIDFGLFEVLDLDGILGTDPVPLGCDC